MAYKISHKSTQQSQKNRNRLQILAQILS